MKIYVRGGLGMQVLELMVGLDVDISLSPRGTSRKRICQKLQAVWHRRYPIKQTFTRSLSWIDYLHCVDLYMTKVA
jgi:hypothetical protein